MRLSLLSTGALLVLHASPLSCQVLPGSYVACARSPSGEMYLCNPATRSVTQLTIPAFLQSDWANCIVMDTPVTGFVGTFNNPSVYGITIIGTTVTATLLNTGPLTGPNECTQLVRIGSSLYVAQWDKLWRVPVSGGAPVLALDLTSLPNWPTGGIANAIASDGVGKIYLAIWTGGQVYTFDTVTSTGTLLMTLPGSKLPSATFSPVNAQMKHPAATSGTLAVCGLYGDVVLVDTTTGAVQQHYFQQSAVGTGQSNSKDALIEVRDSGDWAIGTRDGAIDLLVPVGTDGQLARRDLENVGSGATPNLNRVVAIWYSNAGASYLAFGGGCPGTGNFVPTSVGRGPALRGNGGFALGIDSVNGTGNAAVILGTNRNSPYPIDLTPLGAPACFLRHDALIVIPVATTGTGPGLGWGTLPVPLPNTVGILFTQWASVDSGANALGVAMSDARELRL
jgi:hypothetical protein